MTEERLRPTGENRGKACSVRRDGGRPDRVDAAVEPVQACCGNHPFHRALGVAEQLAQLSNRHNPMLPIGKLELGPRPLSLRGEGGRAFPYMAGKALPVAPFTRLSRAFGRYAAEDSAQAPYRPA